MFLGPDGHPLVRTASAPTASAPTAPVPAAPPTTPAEREAQREATIERIEIARRGLRELSTQATAACRDPRIATATLPAALVEALFFVAVAALDRYVDARVVDDNGVVCGLPDSVAHHADAAAERLVERVNQFAQQDAEPAVRPATRQERRALERLAAKGAPLPGTN